MARHWRTRRCDWDRRMDVRQPMPDVSYKPSEPQRDVTWLQRFALLIALLLLAGLVWLVL